MLLRRASANIKSGSRLPSMWMCSSHFGSLPIRVSRCICVASLLRQSNHRQDSRTSHDGGMTAGRRLPIDARGDRSYEVAPNIEEVPMPASTVASIPAARVALLVGAALVAINAARAEPSTSSALEARVVVTGDGSVSVAPDYAQIRSGVTTRAKTGKGAGDANA